MNPLKLLRRAFQWAAYGTNMETFLARSLLVATAFWFIAAVVVVVVWMVVT